MSQHYDTERLDGLETGARAFRSWEAVLELERLSRRASALKLIHAYLDVKRQSSRMVK